MEFYLGGPCYFCGTRKVIHITRTSYDGWISPQTVARRLNELSFKPLTKVSSGRRLSLVPCHRQQAWRTSIKLSQREYQDGSSFQQQCQIEVNRTLESNRTGRSLMEHGCLTACVSSKPKEPGIRSKHLICNLREPNQSLSALRISGD